LNSRHGGVKSGRELLDVRRPSSLVTPGSVELA